ncbi:DUF2905 domain-containing protein [Bacillus fonticola]|uniref:DUF2905 domain-containing protein n=1 Tax=Bacillus fonticola TaxID=2728853 RepID=UPI001474B14A|nr:DUF2905 domain-containing protein [Bacillus fonticola]
MPPIGKLLMIIGGLVFLIGLIMQVLPIGKLPGDIVWKRGNTTVYFPIVTSIVASVVLSLLFFIFGRLK